MKKIFISLALLFSLNAQAIDLKEGFKKIEGISKGPFALNYLQGTKGRTDLRGGAKNPPGNFLFQAAFRNDTARAMAEEHAFYIGNLFTTNYYELTGRYVYNDAYGSFALNHEALAAAAPQVSAQVAAMTRSWVLEKSYISLFPHSRLARSFAVRGISGAEFEFEYAAYYFNIGLTAVSEDFQFLPLFLLAKTSPLTDASALDQARDMISRVFEDARMQYGESTLVRELYALRNAIHNQVSPEVIPRISAFLKKYPSFNGKGNLTRIQEILTAYYNIGPKQILKVAKAAGVTSVEEVAKEIASKGFSAERGLRLSEALTVIRGSLADKSIVYDKQTAHLVLLATSAQYLNKELSSMKSPSGKEPLLTVANLLYVEGYLIRDNWDYFKSEINAAASTAAAVALIPDLIEIGTDTLTQSFEPAFSQWLSLEPKMQYFVDNTIKASALNTAAHLAKEVK